MYINYRSISDLNETIIRNLHKFPHDVDFVVGVPRSGMMPANLIALYLNKPLTDVDSFVEGRIYSSGERGNFAVTTGSRKVLIVDDSINSGSALMKLKQKLSENEERVKNFNICFAVVFATKKSKDFVDVYCEEVETPRLFQWNIFHHKHILPHSCFDIDGVLCPNPPYDDDGPVYTEYIKNAPALFIPSVEIDTLVSCRLEKYRTDTETWLKQKGVRYNKLIMLDFPDKQSRVAWGKHGLYKGEVYKQSANILFVESSINEALDIYAVSKKPVFCTETMQMINNESSYNKIKSRLGKKRNDLKAFLRKIKKMVIHE
ncbi:Phosphoribosyl transferase domain-containing protein [Fibrobacter sp. UWR3]|uniref:phosphoribosyltransferase family protein n=1 Tax=Fibrobacter sp. UWR3 TaxID=1896217 RepID=UPI000911E454|nr:phosphoribosyltransferase family protein [Fibrobacter sp. UWR3]SHN07933.1 Phosphoribosyl transferase domain-containing protein [Fibrobacter sp. UWR3]